MRIKLRKENFSFDLTPDLEIGAGGEGRVLTVPKHAQLVVKIYHQPTHDRSKKLDAMLRNPPEIPLVNGVPSIIWPQDIVNRIGARNSAPHIGFSMHRIDNMLSLFEFYNPAIRRKKNPLFNYQYLYRCARNLSIVVKHIHDAGHIIGDMNESNILANDQACIALIDTDSFQITDAQTSTLYRCRVGKPEFTPPELQGLQFSEIDQNVHHDNYGLAILIFQLLMEGIHPFAGVYTGSGDPPHLSERIAAGHYPHGHRKVPYKPMPAMPPIDILPPELRKLFDRCFVAGHKSPGLRPSAQEWYSALVQAEKSLVHCKKQHQHWFGNHLTRCPWCEQAKKFGGRDSFPSLAHVQSGKHKQSPVTKKQVFAIKVRPKNTPRRNSLQRIGRFIRRLSLQSNTPPGTRAMRRRKKMQQQKKNASQQSPKDNSIIVKTVFWALISGLIFFGYLLS